MSAAVVDIAPISSARQALAEARTFDDVRDLRDKAATWLDYLRRQRLGLAAQNDAAEMKLRCERALGEQLTEGVAPRGRCLRDESTGQIRGAARTLPEGVTATQSYRWRRAASVPEHVFDAWMAKTREHGEELTTAGLLALAAPAPGVDEPDGDGDDLGADDDGGDDDGADDEAPPPPPPPPPPSMHYLRLAYADATWPVVVTGLRAARRDLGTETDSATILELLRRYAPE